MNQKPITVVTFTLFFDAISQSGRNFCYIVYSLFRPFAKFCFIDVAQLNEATYIILKHLLLFERTGHCLLF